jgi:acyl-CoA synthetase (AMP-forming)/AMP-acid ligase II
VILGDITDNNAILFPEKEGVVDESRRLSFAELADRARRLANALAARGVARGDRVAVIAQNRHEYIEIFSAAEMAGYIAAPVSFRLTAAELTHLLSDCRPAAVCFAQTYEAQVTTALQKLEQVRALICIGGATGGAEDYENVLATAAAQPPPTKAQPEDTAFIIYTSGSTGRPKGVMHSHRGQILSALSFCMDGAIDQQDRILIANPLFHAGGKWMQLGHHLRGCTVFLHRHFEAGALLETIERERITATLLPATMMRAVLDHPDFSKRDLSSLRTVYYSAGPTPVPLLRRALEAFGPILIQYYGGTEAGGVGTALLKHHHQHNDPTVLQRRLASAGQAKPLAKVRVLREDGSDCNVDEPGEIIIRSDAHMQGYWNNPEATAETLKDGWVYTGDIGTRGRDNFIYVVDRKKEMIVSGGANIYSREVEDVLHRHPAVLEAAVIGVPDDKWGETVHAVVVKRPGASITAHDLIEHCRGLIASYKKPTGVTFIEQLPKQENGKVDKLALREPFWIGRDRRVN